MLVVGIPTLNEADNIADLTAKIDAAAQELGIDIFIINADSSSEDFTSKMFLETGTRCKKISIINKEDGKGRNIYSIIKEAVSLDNIEGLMLIDGDITSFSTNWLSSFYQSLKKNNDYIIPVYARNFQEGNATNHFFYPLLYAHTNGNAPRQPIAGDFGLSHKMLDFLMSKAVWHKFCFEYGIDIFLTLQALYNSLKVSEVKLEAKCHKPSFDKMIKIFSGEATSYYETSAQLFNSNKRKVFLSDFDIIADE
ncbi:MAG: glycosyltransferase family 2 protein [Deltaproteobacteria bacterium]|jgi:glycosyltransferase involved in cell wall biosynthesis|nr:glycosyltransferase family 2 protein [Deltaproteobacteria bacterium]